MLSWVKGNREVAAKIDPTVGAAIAAGCEILVRFNLHTRLGLSAEDMLATMLDIAFISLVARSVQINVGRRKSARTRATDVVPANDPSAGPKPDDTAA